MKVPLEKARICLECDTIHDLPSCPECGCGTYYYIANWIRPHRPPRPEPSNPPPPEPALDLPSAKKKRHILRNLLLLGGSLLAAYGLLFKPRRKPPEDQ